MIRKTEMQQRWKYQIWQYSPSGQKIHLVWGQPIVMYMPSKYNYEIDIFLWLQFKLGKIIMAGKYCIIMWFNPQNKKDKLLTAPINWNRYNRLNPTKPSQGYKYNEPKFMAKDNQQKQQIINL